MENEGNPNLEVEEGKARTIPSSNLKSLRLENKRLKQLVILFAILSLLATAGLIAGVVIAVRQSRKASKIIQQETEQPKVTTIYYFNDDRPQQPSPPQPGNGIVDPILVNDNDAIPVNDNGSFVITAEDLETQPPQPIVDRVPINDNNNNNANANTNNPPPNTVVIEVDP